MEQIPFENTALPDIISLEGITQEYDTKDGKATIIKNLDLLIEDKPHQGQFVVVLGVSGCGKSTVLRYIAGLKKPTKGKVLIKGKPLGLRNPVSMVFQQYSSFPWCSILDNVAMGLKYRGVPKEAREEEARKIIDLVGLGGQEKKFPGSLSGGQRQRVAIARCLLTNPEILLMDEPFGALDVSTRLKMQDLLADLWLKIEHDLTVVFVTHDIPEAVYLADEILIMRSSPGQIVKRIQVPFPLERNKELKRTKAFTDLVYDIEDELDKAERASRDEESPSAQKVSPISNNGF